MRAFSLLETILAGLLLGLILFALLSLFPGSLRGMRLGHDRIGASNLAQQLLEEARVTPWSQLQPRDGVTEVDGVKYTWRMVILDSPDGTEDVRVVRAEVGWGKRALTLETRLFRFRNP